MNLDPLSYFQLLAPTMFVIGSIYLLGPMLPLHRGWARVVLLATAWIILLHYGRWRLFETVLDAPGNWREIAWVWFCYGVEIFSLVHAVILHVLFLRRADRHAEADAHEARLRATPRDALPSVDVYIPTYNEPEAVLEKTITGALCMDWPNMKIWVLDDGRRAWLKTYCEEKGVGYITRDNNAHAKAGNINHALTRTDADFFAIFDADFIPQQNFLMRVMGFFADPKIGIVQLPHVFYNHDPMQANLALRKSLPDDQRFFFDAIMPSRDAWDAAFCCGSNSVTRRSALREVGDRLPTESITEDMLLTLALLRKGYITRYLCEPLAFGLAPESLKAFFVQRQRWARGATQILFLKAGPLGPKLRFMHRLFFLPTHWLAQSAMLLLTIIAPIVYLMTGVLPLANVTGAGLVFYILPYILALAGLIVVLAPGNYFPLASQVLGTFQAFKIMPTVLMTMVKPFGHIFKVTPKGSDARAGYERGIFNAAMTLIILTVIGMMVNTFPEWRIIEPTASLTAVAAWGAVNLVTLILVCMMSLQAPVHRGEERFKLDERVWLFGPRGTLTVGHVEDLSLSGALIYARMEPELIGGPEEVTRLFIEEVGFVAGRIIRHTGSMLAIAFDLPPGVERDLLIRKLFTTGFNTAEVEATAASVTVAMLSSIVTLRSAVQGAQQQEGPAAPVEKLKAECLVVAPKERSTQLADLSAARRSYAA